jgi:hypothetical protein
MLYLLKRHPFAVEAFFRRSLVLTYAFPAAALTPLVAPGLTLDCHRGYGFLAIALVETERLRPARLPETFGTRFFLSGYRIFVRLSSGRNSLRGLQILRSYTDRRRMEIAGNLFTRYRYRRCQVNIDELSGEVEYRLRTPGAEADLDVIARPGVSIAAPFDGAKEARRFAGPLPYTFDYEPETQSIVYVRGVRAQWDPQPVAAEVSRNTFLNRDPFRAAGGALAAAFMVYDVAYRWERGIRVPLEIQ